MAFDRSLHLAASRLVIRAAECLTVDDVCRYGWRAVSPARPSAWPTCDGLIAWVDPPSGGNTCDLDSWATRYHLAIVTATCPDALPSPEAVNVSAWQHLGMVAQLLHCLTCDQVGWWKGSLADGWPWARAVPTFNVSASFTAPGVVVTVLSFDDHGWFACCGWPTLAAEAAPCA
jgi:hypothetical protein